MDLPGPAEWIFPGGPVTDEVERHSSDDVSQAVEVDYPRVGDPVRMTRTNHGARVWLTGEAAAPAISTRPATGTPTVGGACDGPGWAGSGGGLGPSAGRGAGGAGVGAGTARGRVGPGKVDGGRGGRCGYPGAGDGPVSGSTRGSILAGRRVVRRSDPVRRAVCRSGSGQRTRPMGRLRAPMGQLHCS